MKIRRVVTGHGPDRKSGVASDTLVDPVTIALAPGTEFFTLWGGDDAPSFPDDGSPHAFSTYFPPSGGFRFCVTTVAPERVRPEVLDIEAAAKEMEEKLPGMAARMDPNIPGMHSSDTIDFIYVISGEIWMTLDDGTEVHLLPGETLVQNGTRHAWRNKGAEPCRFVICLIGTPPRGA
ncbi:MAG: cupin domain-containing protein [Syntrophorhabdales bacterium]|jgi:mannose-6-phosphate isomerase-like protein (cupin superfamily)